MATTTSRTRPSAPLESAGRNGNGRTAPSHVAPPKRRVRLPELAVGILVTVLFALGAVLWHLNATTKVPALAVSTEVRRGEVIESVRVKGFETFVGQRFLMSASRLGSLIQATLGSLGGVGRRPQNRPGLAA